MGDKKPKYLVIMRHAEGAGRDKAIKPIPYAELSDAGYEAASAVARRLGETLRVEGVAADTTDILIVRPPDGPAAATADIVAEEIRHEYDRHGHDPVAVEQLPSDTLRAGALIVEAGPSSIWFPRTTSRMC